MDSESVIHDELSQYKVIEHLESIDPDEYHAFLYHLLNHFKGASVALEFLFNEILRYEPAASPLIQKLREILIILSNLGFMHSWSEFIAFSSQPPFALHLDEQRFTDFLRREITESSLTKLRSVCSLLSIPESTAYYCFVVKTLFDSQSKPSLFPLFLSHSSLQLELRGLLCLRLSPSSPPLRPPRSRRPLSFLFGMRLHHAALLPLLAPPPRRLRSHRPPKRRQQR